MRLALLLSLLFFTIITNAAVYKWVDKDGKIHYSDKPINNSEVVEFDNKTQNQIKLHAKEPKAPEPVAPDEPKSLYQLSINDPVEDETLRDNEGNITITASITPELAMNHALIILMDGKELGFAQKSPIFRLENIDRGEHSFVVKVVAKNGKQLASSSPRKIFLHRTIVNRTPRTLPSTGGG